MRGSSVGARGTASSTDLPWASWSPGWCSTPIPRRSRPSFGSPISGRSVPEQLEWDFERFKREGPRDLAGHVREAYRIDLTARYLGETLPHPIGKGSGQLSLSAGQLEDDASAGLAFVVLKTLIAEDETGARTMAAWAVHETKMKVEARRTADGRDGWTVTWKGRGWDRSLADYLALVRAGRDLTRAGRLLAVPSVKYHLPRLEEPFRDAEYAFTTRALAEAWGEAPPFLEQDLSPTLAGALRHRQYPFRPDDRRIRHPRLLVGSAAHVLPVAARGVSGDRWFAHAARAARLAPRPAQWPDRRHAGA